MKKIAIHFNKGLISGYTNFEFFRGDLSTVLIVEVENDFNCENWKVVNSELVPKDPEEITLRDLNRLKAEKISKIEKERDIRLFNGMIYNGKKIHTDTEAINNYHMYLNEYNSHMYSETNGVFDNNR